MLVWWYNVLKKQEEWIEKKEYCISKAHSAALIDIAQAIKAPFLCLCFAKISTGAPNRRD